MSLDLKGRVVMVRPEESIATKQNLPYFCLLYTSDAADE